MKRTVLFCLIALAAGLLSQTPGPSVGTTMNMGQFPQIIRDGVAPAQTVTVVADTTNLFQLPASTSVCIVVARGVVQALGIDYNMVPNPTPPAPDALFLSFTAAPAVGDVIQLNCW